jgi:hypothetical protein
MYTCHSYISRDFYQLAFTTVRNRRKSVLAENVRGDLNVTAHPRSRTDAILEPCDIFIGEETPKLLETFISSASPQKTGVRFHRNTAANPRDSFGLREIWQT